MKCPSCGAEMVLDPASQKLVCEYCGTVLEPVSEKPEDTAAEEARKKAQEAKEHKADGAYYEATAYTCQVCGAELLTTDDTAVTFCSYCGSQSILPGRIERLKKPAFVIPFGKTKEDCEAAYRKVLRSARFVPKNMAQEETIQKFRGIYMPYWVYDMKTDELVQAKGHEESRHGDYIHKRHYLLTKIGRAEYDKISFDASSAFSDNLSQCIAPYDVSEGKAFDTAYLSGFYPDVADVEAKVYKPDAAAIASTHLAKRMIQDPAFIRYGVNYRDVADQIHFRSAKEELGLFPVWFLGCRSKDGQRVSYAVVNGQTGKVAADLPIDFGRYLKGSLLLALPIFLILSFLLTLTPASAVAASTVLAVLGLLVTNSQLNEIHQREYQLDDKGKIRDWIESDEQAPKKMPWAKKQAYLWKPLISILISIGVFLFNPASDLIFYAAICLSMAVMLLNFRDLVKGHNELTTRKLPQMEARGGDEHE